MMPNSGQIGFRRRFPSSYPRNSRVWRTHRGRSLRRVGRVRPRREAIGRSCQEDVVERGPLEGDRGRRRPGSSSARSSAGSLCSPSSSRRAARSPSSLVSVRTAFQRSRPAAGSSSLSVTTSAASSLLERARGALGDHQAVVDDDEPVAQRVGLVEVVGGEQHAGARSRRARISVPEVGPVLRVEAGGGLVEEEQRRPVHQAERRSRTAASGRRRACARRSAISVG